MRREMVIYFLGKSIPAGVNLAIILLAVRILGEEEYGKYSLIFYAAMLISTFTAGWIQQSVLRFLTSYPENRTETVNRFFFMSLVSSSVALVAGFLVSILYFGMGWGASLLISLYIVLYNHYLFCLIINQASIKPVRYIMIEGLYHIVWLGGFLMLTLVLGWKIYLTLFIAMIAGLVITELARSTILPGGRLGLSVPLIKPDAHLGKKAMSFGFPITIWLFLAYLVTVSDRFVITEVLGYKDAGTYSAVKDFIIKISTFSTMPILLVYHPAIVSKWNAGDKREAMRMIGRGVRYSVLVAFLTGTCYLLFSGRFYNTVMHINVDSQLNVSLWLLVSAFLWQVSLLAHKPLELLLKPGLMLIAILISLGFNIIANLILVPVAGYLAAAVVSLLSVMVYIGIVGVFLFRFSKKGMLV